LDKKDRLALTSDDSIIFRSFVSCKIMNKGSRVSKLIVTGTPPLI